ncbi:hypothetical protein Vqi01_15380 [Micromonospora qiuiae]|uniref:ESX-1 secretion-associated protein n=1 Tax=Micromonospora qiuiae TaxID=502268 RepID=A0ABQ4J8N7_9ACTN|nr:hypothetical protein [Micromonospora qiuiae]GIJ26376.1 hypothetical protein Vqi01_15380 [Micromonospora qiuiae]
MSTIGADTDLVKSGLLAAYQKRVDRAAGMLDDAIAANTPFGPIRSPTDRDIQDQTAPLLGALVGLVAAFGALSTTDGESVDMLSRVLETTAEASVDLASSLTDAGAGRP